ncbi:hypothetical protein AX769_07700 [Frondihabitans sp. PAMC 28766]|uniref:DUF4166 domain-containing protein n=1 Tax=Frondihabitans sp. PAMC 28766 TaxID=1795630 RepID=UPI00078E902D|nr:DUF4166 domain-containing protein [Frondihabitans sp. PAMC 28766]AMM20069.1 hypothetical protein AX769_07700 [Frondihabitans sp. PAMC 28766]
MPSPYEIVLGDELARLHPRLGEYFGEISAGSVGRGAGVFDRVGTPRRWLWPVLALLAREGIAFPVWQEGVPFDVENRPLRDQHGDIAVGARRTFHLQGGTRVMVDAITADNRGEGGAWRLVDHLGPGRRLSASLGASVRDGALTLRSTGVGVRVGRRRLPILPLVAPLVTLTERFDDDAQKQHVSIALSMPVIGRVYEYSGFFTYNVETEHQGK